MSDFENHYYEETYGAIQNEPVECEARTLRTCPRCGAKLFEDMDVCYGCLYDFNQADRAQAQYGYPLGTQVPIPQGDEEIWGSLDELIPEAVPPRMESHCMEPQRPTTPRPQGTSPYAQGGPQCQPRNVGASSPDSFASASAAPKIMRLVKGERLEIVGNNLKLVLTAD